MLKDPGTSCPKLLTARSDPVTQFSHWGKGGNAIASWFSRALMRLKLRVPYSQWPQPKPCAEFGTFNIVLFFLNNIPKIVSIQDPRNLKGNNFPPDTKRMSQECFLGCLLSSGFRCCHKDMIIIVTAAILLQGWNAERILDILPLDIIALNQPWGHPVQISWDVRKTHQKRSFRFYPVIQQKASWCSTGPRLGHLVPGPEFLDLGCREPGQCPLMTWNFKL